MGRKREREREGEEKEGWQEGVLSRAKLSRVDLPRKSKLKRVEGDVNSPVSLGRC